jgi:predicted acyl esterase
MRRLAAVLVLAGLGLLAPATAQADITSVFGGSVPCTTQPDGVRFCGSTTPRSTTPTFDGVPIDVNVAFPAGSDGPFPLIMMFHGYGGSKIGLSSMQEWLDKGYATFSMTDRGFHESCGTAAAKAADPGGCASGWIRLMDDRYEVRDAQFFSGRLVDEGLVQPTKLGAIGGSYGGGMSMALATLKNRTMLPDGSLVPWTSPNGTPMQLAAAAPNIPWSDLAYSLTPNGRTLDYVRDAPYQGRFGVEKQSLVTGLYLSGCSAGFCSPPGVDPESDLTSWKALLDAGEPYDGNPAAQAILNEITSHHSSYYIDHSQPPAPLLISNGFTDDLFPVDEALRFYNRTESQYSAKQAPISLFFGDFGHPRAQNKPDAIALLDQRSQAWFDYYIKEQGTQPFLGVEAMTQTCPKTAPSGGPFTAKNWASLSRGEIRFDSPGPKTITPGSAPNGALFDPGFGGGACAAGPGNDVSSEANYRLPPATAGGYTLMGSPTVIANFLETDPNSQVAARLLDVGPDGQETLVARGLWRPQVGPRPVKQVFQMHANGYRFESGHIAKVELLSSDALYGRQSNDPQPVTVSDLHLRLPVLEKPGSLKSLIKAPAPKVLPKGYKLAKDFEGFGSAGAKPKGRLKITGGKLRMLVKCPGSWATCRKGKVTVKGASGTARFLVAKGSFGQLAGGKTKRVALGLRSRARGYLRHNASLRVKVSTTTKERLGPLNVTKQLKAP